MNKDELIAEIDALRRIIAMGHERMKENQYIDMEMMQAKVDEACQEVAELSPDDAVEVRDSLTSLLGDLQGYAAVVSEAIDEKNDEGAG